MFYITIKAITGAIVSRLVKTNRGTERDALNFALDSIAGDLNVSLKDLEVLSVEEVTK